MHRSSGQGVSGIAYVSAAIIVVEACLLHIRAVVAILWSRSLASSLLEIPFAAMAWDCRCPGGFGNIQCVVGHCESMVNECIFTQFISILSFRRFGRALNGW